MRFYQPLASKALLPAQNLIPLFLAVSASTLMGCTVWNSTSIGTEFQRADSLISSGIL